MAEKGNDLTIGDIIMGTAAEADGIIGSTQIHPGVSASQIADEPQKRRLMQAQLSEIYNLQCHAGLNKEYYGIRLSKVQNRNRWIEILIAVGTAGSGVSGASALTDWGIAYIKFVWACLAGISAMLAIMKPILQYNKQIERLSKLFGGYSETYTTINLIVSTIKFNQAVSDDDIAAFRAVQRRFIELAADDDPSADAKLKDRCEELIRKRHSPDSVWYPE